MSASIPTKGIALTPAQILLLRHCENGADVWSYGDAMDLREIQRLHPQLVKIGKAKMPPRNGAERQPYFGIILTKAGRNLLAEFGEAVMHVST